MPLGDRLEVWAPFHSTSSSQRTAGSLQYQCVQFVRDYPGVLWTLYQTIFSALGEIICQKRVSVKYSAPKSPAGRLHEPPKVVVSCRSRLNIRVEMVRVSRLVPRPAIAGGCAIHAHHRAKRIRIVRPHKARTLPPRKSKLPQRDERRHRNQRRARRRHIVLRHHCPERALSPVLGPVAMFEWSNHRRTI